MKQTLSFPLIFIFCVSILSCKSEKKETENVEKFFVDKNLPQNDTIKFLSKYPELKLYNNEIVESPTRTACVVQKSGYSDRFYYTNKSFHFEDYKCKAEYKGDTIDIWLNNNNGYFGNGVLVKVFNDRFLIKDIDPKTLRGEIKFINSYPTHQKLILNKNKYLKNDSLYGFIDYQTNVDSLVAKNFKGYFRTVIK
jgi:hypothetical protein